MGIFQGFMEAILLCISFLTEVMTYVCK